MLRDILQELAKADSVRTLKDAPALGTANAVTTILKKMRTTGNYNSSDNDDYTESYLGASLDKDNESMATTSTCGRRRKGKTAKKKTPTKKGRTMRTKRKRKRMTARIAKSLDLTPPPKHLTR